MRRIRIYNRTNLIDSATCRPMIVCVCRRVSDRDIARLARNGLGFDEIQFELGVATQCGRCEGCARDVVNQCCATQPVAAIADQGAAQASQWASCLPSAQA